MQDNSNKVLCIPKLVNKSVSMSYTSDVSQNTSQGSMIS
jgi:hypothetical protein